MAIRKSRQGKKDIGTNQVDTYYFDVEKCKVCPLREGCYKEGAKTKTYSVSIKSELHLEQIAFQQTDYYKEKSQTPLQNRSQKQRVKERSRLRQGYFLRHRKYANAGCNGYFRSEFEKNSEINVGKGSVQ